MDTNNSSSSASTNGKRGFAATEVDVDVGAQMTAGTDFELDPQEALRIR